MPPPWMPTTLKRRESALDRLRIAFDPGPHADGTASYRMTSQGFTCTGSSLDDEPAVTWSCLRGTAVVRCAVRPL